MLALVPLFDILPYMGGIRVDVLVVTALMDELDAVLELQVGGEGRSAWTLKRDRSGFPYHVREIENAHGEALRVAAALSDMGESAAAVRAVGLIKDLDPVCLAMCGICAGRRGDVFLGDAIIADRVFSYDHGKFVATTAERDDEFFHDIKTYNLESTWKVEAQYFAREFQQNPKLTLERPPSKATQVRWLLHKLFAHETGNGPSPLDLPERDLNCPGWEESIEELRNSALIETKLGTLKLTEKGRSRVEEERLRDPNGRKAKDPAFRVHVGPIATGKTVREDPKQFERLKRHVRKVLGVEMEAAAIGLVAEELKRRSIIVKSVSDYADHEKDDAFRHFACHTAASVLMEFIRKHMRPKAKGDFSNRNDRRWHSHEDMEDDEQEEQLPGVHRDDFLARVARACLLRVHAY